ncbi:MAG TPA: aldo/keto reductase [Nocardioides sp.]|nr:aldo/keto reductase [Nocardioides sp.]
MGTGLLGDRKVSRVGFGAKRLLRAGYTSDDRAAAVGLLRAAVELGVDHIDTAAFYPSVANHDEGPTAFTSLDIANELIREALAPYDDGLVIATKVGPTRQGLARPDQLRALVEADLRALGRDCLDLVYLRQAGLQSVAEHFGVLAELRDAGMIRHLGLSGVRPEHLAQAQEIAPVVAVSNRYAVDFGRVNDALVDSCGEQGIAFVPFFSLTGEQREAGGLAAHDQVGEVARAHGATEAEVRLAWALSRGPHVLVIPGTSSKSHLVENLAAADLELSPEELAALG